MSLATVLEADVINADDANWIALSAAAKQSLLDKGSVYLDAVYTWPGVIESDTQLDSWPRKCVSGTLKDRSGRDLTGSIPQAVKVACSVIAGIQRSSDVMNTSFVSTTTSTSVAGGDLIYTRAKAEGVETEKRYSSASTSSSSSSSSPLKFTSDGIQRSSYVDALLSDIVGKSKVKQVTRY